MQCFSWAQVVGFVLIALSAWVAFIAYKERRRWLLTWSSVYFATSVFMTLLTYIKGPDPHDMFGCRWVPAPPSSCSLSHGSSSQASMHYSTCSSSWWHGAVYAGTGSQQWADWAFLCQCCSVPFSLWVGSLFVATLSYYTSDYMRQGQDAPEKRNERYVYDPTAGELCTSASKGIYMRS
jgi:hypothetical protein